MRTFLPQRRGFTLVEVLLAIVLLAMGAAAVTALFVSGIQALDDQSDRSQVQSLLRSTMEELVSTPFASLANGTNTVTIGTQTHLITKLVKPMDMNGDAVPEADAKLVTVTVSGESLTMLLVDQKDRTGKL